MQIEVLLSNAYRQGDLRGDKRWDGGRALRAREKVFHVTGKRCTREDFLEEARFGG